MGFRISRRTWIGITLAVAVVSAGAGVALTKRAGSPADAQKGPPPVALEFGAADLAYLTQAPLARWLAVSGTLAPLRQATVKAKVSGDLREVRVREGETVRAGQLLARIDTADLDARLIERQGALESARAQLALAEKTRTTNVKLLNENFISQTAFDSSQSGYDVARGAVKSAEAQVKLAENAVRDALVVAPIDGVVAKRHAQPGEKVAFDSPIVTVVDLADLELQALVPAIDVPELAIGMAVELTVDGFGDRRFAGRIGRINPATEPGTRAILVYVGLRNADAALRGGMFATGRIALAAGAPAATLPLAAVRTEAGQSHVWAIEGGKLVRRMVVLGKRDDDAGVVEIRTALSPDLPVLATRFENLKEGSPALVKAPAPTSRPAQADAPATG
ncbi:MAG: efflux RND transporter periplasmic adaptor subunit [Burkholderiales bacterium]